MPLQIIRNDITRVEADAIVNTANPEPVVGGGTDSAIYQAAGKEQMLEARRKIGPIAPGQAAVTPAFALKAKYVIHTVGPVWIDGTHGEREILARCYGVSLATAKELGCRSVAFPLISSGVYGFPDGEALTVALDAIQRFLVDTDEDMQVTLVVFGKNTTVLSARIREGVKEYIDEAEVNRLRREEYGWDGSMREREIRRRRQMRKQMYEERMEAVSYAGPPSAKAAAASAPAPAKAAPAGGPLEKYLPKKEDTFTDRLLRLVNESGRTNVGQSLQESVLRHLQQEELPSVQEHGAGAVPRAPPGYGRGGGPDGQGGIRLFPGGYDGLRGPMLPGQRGIQRVRGEPRPVRHEAARPRDGLERAVVKAQERRVPVDIPLSP